ncbi:acetamidase/formamidase family protein [Halopseudomonas pachastrellae]|nr:acetamidase/formamidase family protein [Halopseudomonas pachastrellae]
MVTVYEVHQHTQPPHAKAVYSFRWTPQTDPFGVVHPTIDYPGVPVDHSTIDKQFGVLAKAQIPVRPHFGVMAVAPRESGMVDSIPPSYFGGNMDNWRAGKGAHLFLPVSVAGALFSVGDPHASQGIQSCAALPSSARSPAYFSWCCTSNAIWTGSFSATSATRFWKQMTNGCCRA